MRFHLDENIPNLVAAGLLRRNIEVTSRKTPIYLGFTPTAQFTPALFTYCQ
jgi:hypothetical protein